MRRLLLLLFLLLLTLAIGLACQPGDDDDSNSSDNDDLPAIASATVGDDDDDTSQQLSVLTDYFMIDANEPDPNPVKGAYTDSYYNQIPVYRYRMDTGDEPPAPVSSILIMLSGYGCGPNAVAIFAHDLVERSKGTIEVWAPDRRSFLLEDQTGQNEAELTKDPQWIEDYYYNNVPIDGKFFEGFIGPKEPETDMMSEWGLDLRMRDLRTLIEHVPAANRQTNVYIGGHSRGARFAQIYAAYEFEDGHLGSDDLAGILLLDYMSLITDLDEADYLQQLDEIRQGTLPRYNMSKFGIPVHGLVTSAIMMSMAASEGFENQALGFGPNGTWLSESVPKFLQKIVTRGHDVILTNEAWVGFLFDEASAFLPNFFAHFGSLIGGEISPGGLGSFPSEDGATYSWLPYDQTDPQELADMRRLIKVIYEGPGDVADTYHANRVQLDNKAVGHMETEGTWQHNYFHLYTSRVDTPVFALEGFVGKDSGYYESYRDQLAPVRGQSNPRTEVGFTIYPVHDWGHIEVVLVEPDRNPFYDAYLDWMEQWSTGTVQVPLFGNTF